MRVGPVDGSAPHPQPSLQLGEDTASRSVAHPPSGEEIVAGMTAGREWWQLSAFDVAPWIRGLPVSIRTDKQNRLGWLGRP